jgi:uncharacterized repeat protein (TIGR01451 family)
MRRCSTFHHPLAILLFLLAFTGLNAQRKSPAQAHQLIPLSQKQQSIPHISSQRKQDPQGNEAAKTAAITPVPIGSAANAMGAIITENNCVFANDSTGEVIFIHRNNPSIWGGTGFGLRYDISTDNGLTWTTDRGELNPTNQSGRYPQIAGYDAPGSTTPLTGKVIWTAEHFVTPNWTGFAVGTSSRVTTGNPVIQDTLLTTSLQSPNGSLTEGKRGEYWTCRFTYDGTNITDTLKIYKGIYNTGTQTVAWGLHATKIMPWSMSYDGTAHALSPSVAFSPDGNTGWIATLGDLATAPDSLFYPILLKSTDGGATWGNPVEVDLNSFPWVYDSLRALWVDSLGNPASTGRATAAFDYDLTVDASGNPHMFFVIATGSAATQSPMYSLYSGLAKYAVDLTSFNQGTNFDLRLVAPILTFRTMEFGATATTVNMDNYPQISRTQDGNYILYSWTDSDTCIFTGSMNGIGFGESDNAAPNLWIAGMRLSDGYFTCITGVSAGDLIWEGRVMFPQMAPEVLVSGSGPNSVYHLPIVVTEMPAMEPADPTFYHYFGNDAILAESLFTYPPGSTVTWMGCGVNPGIAAHIRGKLYADLNANNTFDGNDIAIRNHTVTTTGITYAGHTNALGDYNISCAPNNTYGVVTNPFNSAIWTASLPVAPYSVTPVPLQNLTGYDFAVQPVGSQLDLAVDIVIPSMRSGFTNPGTIYISNYGNQPASGTLTFNYDTVATLSSASPTWTTNNAQTHQATWALPTIGVFQTMRIDLNLYLPPGVPLNTALPFSVMLATSGQDADGYNNQDATDAIVIGSYDPNDKTASPAGTGTNHQVAPGTELSYRIRFQNTGTASAINIVVRDTLDTDLDITTLKMLGASHPYVLNIDQSRFLAWEFANIHLPDSFSNEPGSHGHIDFSIRPKAGLSSGTVVENSAAIYFDFNAPVITNTAWITYDVTIGTPPMELATGSVRIVPHPVGSHATIVFERTNDQPWAFELTDLQGRTILRQERIAGDSYDLDRGLIPAGMYLYKVMQSGNLSAKGRMLFR